MTSDMTPTLIWAADTPAPEAQGEPAVSKPPIHPLLDIFVHVHDDDEQEARLAAAATLAVRLGALLTCVQVSPDISAVAADPLGGCYYVPQAAEAQSRLDDAERGRVDAFLESRIHGHRWQHVVGHPVQGLVQAASLADLLIVSEGRALAAATKPKPLAGHLAMVARAPVLVLPAAMPFDLSRPALVAWNGSFESAQALRFATPLLALAPSVEIVVVGGNARTPTAADAQSYLSRRGIASTVRRLHHPIGLPVAALLIEHIHHVRPAFVAMGAYGHARALELVFGGVTQRMLEDMPAPLLFAH